MADQNDFWKWFTTQGPSKQPDPAEPTWRDPAQQAAEARNRFGANVDPNELQIDPWHQVFNTGMWGVTSLLPAPGGRGPQASSAGMARKGPARRPARDSATRSKGWSQAGGEIMPINPDAPMSEQRAQYEPAPAKPEPALGPAGREGKGFKYAPDRAQQDQLATAAKDDPRSRDWLIHDVQGALQRIARRFGRPDRSLTSNERADKPSAQGAEAQVSQRDLLQEGMASFSRALPNYNQDEGGFMKFLFPQVQRDVGRYAVEAGRNVSGIPQFEAPRGEINKRILKTAKDFEARHGKQPSAAFIRLKLGDKSLSDEMIGSVLEGHNAPRREGKTVSLDAPVRGKGAEEDSEPMRLGDTFATPPTQERGENRSVYEKALSALTPEEQNVLLLKYDQGLSVRQAAQQANMPTSNYTRAVAKAEAKLRSLIQGTDAPVAPKGTKPIGGGSDGPVDPYNPAEDKANGRKAFEQTKRNDQILKDNFNQRTTDDYARFVTQGDPRPGKEPDPSITRQIGNPKQNQPDNTFPVGHPSEYQTRGAVEPNDPHVRAGSDALNTIASQAEPEYAMWGHKFYNLTPGLEVRSEAGNERAGRPLMGVSEESWMGNGPGTQPYHRRPMPPISGGSDAESPRSKVDEAMKRLIGHLNGLSGGMRWDDRTHASPTASTNIPNSGKNLQKYPLSSQGAIRTPDGAVGGWLLEQPVSDLFDKFYRAKHPRYNSIDGDGPENKFPGHIISPYQKHRNFRYLPNEREGGSQLGPSNYKNAITGQEAIKDILGSSLNRVDDSLFRNPNE